MLNSQFDMLTHLECTRCGEHYPADRPQSVCPKDAGVLYARYDLATIKRTFSSARLAARAPTMWRYDAVLPAANPVSSAKASRRCFQAANIRMSISRMRA